MTEEKDEIMTVDDVAAYLGCARRTIFRKMKANKFPEPRRLGSHQLFWMKSDLIELLNKDA